MKSVKSSSRTRSNRTAARAAVHAPRRALRTTRSVPTQRRRGAQRQRNMSAAADAAGTVRVASAMFDTTGNPVEVLYLQEQEIHNPKTHLPDTKVFARTLASPINPADINLVEGTYGLPSNPPAIGGNEGVFEILATGPESTLKPGDWVIPVFPGYGTWRSHVLGDTIDFLKVPNDIANPLDVATIMVNPCTAFRILEDFVDLKEGDYVVQNGANSSVGRALIQLSKAAKVNSINIIRERETPEQTQALIAELTALGAEHVLTDTQLRDRDFVKNYIKEKNLPSQKLAKLGVNCVGGTAMSDLTRWMEPAGTVVTYGGMSKKPALIGTGSFIFQDLTFKGFWMTRWNQEHAPTDPERLAMYTKLFYLVKEGQLTQKHEVHKISNNVDLLVAVRAALQSQKQAKVVLDWSHFQTETPSPLN